MKKAIGAMTLIYVVAIVSGCVTTTGQIAEAPWQNETATTTIAATSTITATTVLTETRYWFNTSVEAFDFKRAANYTGSDYKGMECVERYNSEGTMVWLCSLTR